jgi:hypothetical protein
VCLEPHGDASVVAMSGLSSTPRSLSLSEHLTVSQATIRFSIREAPVHHALLDVGATDFRGLRGMHRGRSKPRRHYADQSAIHPKAMPVILTTREEIGTWMTASAVEALKLRRPLADGMLMIVARGEKKGLGGLAA